MTDSGKRFDLTLGSCNAVKAGRYIVYHDRGHVRRLLRIDSHGDLRVYRPTQAMMLTTLRNKISQGTIELEELFD